MLLCFTMISQRDPKGRPEEAKGMPKGDQGSQTGVQYSRCGEFEGLAPHEIQVGGLGGRAKPSPPENAGGLGGAQPPQLD